MAEQYKIEWSSRQCPDSQTEGNAIISRAATNFTIHDLRAGTDYSVSLTAINPVGNFTSSLLSMHTLEMGECIAGIMHCLY